MNLKILEQVPQEIINFTAGRNSAVTTNIYLRVNQNIPSNLAGFTVPFDATIIAISANRNGTGNAWTGEVRVNPSTSAIASISLLGSESSKVDNTLSVDVDEGDILSVFMSGTSINRPKVDVFLIRR